MRGLIFGAHPVGAPVTSHVRGHVPGNMRLLDNLYSSPGQLLGKARRDRDALIAAEKTHDEVGVRDKLFDFSVSIHSMLDWIKSLYPNHETAAFALLDATPSLRACRDIANSNKHYELDLGAGPYRRFPPVVDYSMSASVSHSLGTRATIRDGSHRSQPSLAPARHLKVIYVTGSRARVESIADEAIAAWEGFLAKHGILCAPNLTVKRTRRFMLSTWRAPARRAGYLQRWASGPRWRTNRSILST